MDATNLNVIQERIRKKYAEVSRSAEGKFAYLTGRAGAEALGYPPDIIQEAPSELLDSFCGVGNPFSLGDIRKGESLLDVGCGAGFDLYVASRLVGPTGHVSGIDITPEMIDKGRKMLTLTGAANIEIRLVSSEDISYNENSFDVIISNGVLNLSPDKGKSFREIYRVLRHGGRLQFADIISTAESCRGDSCSIDAWSQ